MWWRVYKSNEFIINAFKYANKYAPKNVELYYNDFGETDNTKCEGIVKLINDVKSADGTRLDALVCRHITMWTVSQQHSLRV